MPPEASAANPASPAILTLAPSAVAADPAGLPLPADVPRPPGAGASGRVLRRGGLLFSAANFIGMGLGLVASMAMVRAAAPPEIASYLLLLQAATALGLLFQLGLAQGMLRFAPTSRGAGGEAATRTLRRRMLGLQLAIWLVLAPPVALAWPWLARRLDAPELAGAWGWLLATAMLASLSRLLDAYLRAFRYYSASAFLTTVMPRVLLVAGFLPLALSAPRGTSWAVLMAVFVGGQLATTAVYAGFLPSTSKGEASEPRRAQEPPGVWPIFTTTTAMGLRSAAALLMTSSDLWVLSWASSHEEVAVYGVVSRVIAVVGALALAANFLLPQEFAVLHADGKRAELERLARTAATAVAMLALAASLAIVVLGRPLLRLAYGEAYAGGWVVLLILAVGSFWDAASGSAGYVLQMTGHHMTLLRLTVAAAVANLLLSLALAPRFGGPGVAAATAVTLIALNLANVRAARKLVGVRTFVYLEPAEWRRVLGQVTRGLRGK